MTLRASFLMADSVRVADRGPRRRTMLPSCSRPSRTLRAAEGGGPKQGHPSPPLRAPAGAAQVGTEGWSAVEQKDAGRLPTSASHVPWRTREAEAPHASRRAHQFQKWASCRLPKFESCFVLRCPRPSFYARKFNPTDAKTFIAAADTKKAMVKIGDANRS